MQQHSKRYSILRRRQTSQALLDARHSLEAAAAHADAHEQVYCEDDAAKAVMHFSSCTLTVTTRRILAGRAQRSGDHACGSGTGTGSSSAGETHHVEVLHVGDFVEIRADAFDTDGNQLLWVVQLQEIFYDLQVRLSGAGSMQVVWRVGA